MPEGDQDEHAEQASESPPYVFDDADVTTAAALLSAGCADLDYGYRAVRRLTAAAEVLGVGDSPLMWELVHAVGHDLQHDAGGRPGCSLGREVDERLLRWPRPVANAPDDALRLWEAAAAAVTVPAAVARLEDLLFSRRVGNGLERARRASASYLEAVDDASEIGMSEVDALLRAWTLTRSVGEVELEAEIRDRMAGVVRALMEQDPGSQPGVVLPFLRALAQAPLEGPDPHDVDGLLARAASVYRSGYLGSQIAADRRARAGGDETRLKQIACDEVAAYFAEANDSRNAAVRMHHLNAAARVATDREGSRTSLGKPPPRCSASIPQNSGCSAFESSQRSRSTSPRAMSPRSPAGAHGEKGLPTSSPPTFPRAHSTRCEAPPRRPLGPSQLCFLRR